MKIELREFLDKRKKEWPLIASTIAITILLIGGLSYASRTAGGNSSVIASVYVPVEFLESRKRAADAADVIASLTEESAEKLSLVNGADQRGDYIAGLSIVREEIDRGVDIRNTAVDLSEELREMAITLGTVQPNSASAVGFQAVTVGIELVQRLVSYNNNLQELLGTLQARLENNGGEQTGARIEELVSALNEEAQVINSLSIEYKQLMVQFDELTS